MTPDSVLWRVGIVGLGFCDYTTGESCTPLAPGRGSSLLGPTVGAMIANA